MAVKKGKKKPRKITPKQMEKILRGPSIEERVLIQRGYGLTYETWARKLAEELEAQTTKFFSDKGKIEDQVDVIDWKTRQQARKDLGDVVGEKQADESGKIVVIIDKS